MKRFVPVIALSTFVLGSTALVLAPQPVYAAAKNGAADASSKTKEQELIRVLLSDAAPAEKAITCKKLAVFGSEAAVPALAPLLTNPELSSWARIPLEAIPGDAAEKALRDAMTKVNGRLLVGIINSIGYRRDEKATRALTEHLRDSDTQVACAAAVALGKIGGSAPEKALRKALAEAPNATRGAVAQGCILCAEGYLNRGKESAAAKLYELVRTADVPKQRVLEATRGVILAQGSAGLPLLLQDLRSEDKDLLAIALRTARELPGHEITKALASELNNLPSQRQPLLLLALGDRNDPVALPQIVAAARSASASPELRVAAIGVLERLGNVSSVPVLLTAALSQDSSVAQAAKTALTRLPGTDVDGELQKQFHGTSGKGRQIVIELIGRRQITGAMPLVVSALRDQDAGVRASAVQATGLMGTGKEADMLVKLMETSKQPRERADIEAALLGICGRDRDACVAPVLTLTKSTDPELRTAGLHALASAGGPDALAAVKSTLEDSDGAVQDEAVRVLSSWPNTWPEDKTVAEPLMSLAKSANKNSHQVLALRGYLQYLQGNKDLKPAEKVQGIDAVLPLMRRAEEKRLAIPILQPIATADSVDLLMNLAGDPSVATDAYSAIVRSAGSRSQQLSKDQREKALKAVLEKCQDDGVKKRAEKLLADSK